MHFAKSILGGKPLQGLWFNRTAEFAARNRGEDFGRLKYAEEEVVVLSQFPCWADLTPEQYRDRIAELVEEVEAEARADREAREVEPLGVEAILRQDPHARPTQTRKSPAPACHAASKAFRKKFWEEYSAFVADFRDAAEKLKRGEWPVKFPLGSFPPGLPFVSAYSAQSGTSSALRRKPPETATPSTYSHRARHRLYPLLSPLPPLPVTSSGAKSSEEHPSLTRVRPCHLFCRAPLHI